MQLTDWNLHTRCGQISHTRMIGRCEVEAQRILPDVLVSPRVDAKVPFAGAQGSCCNGFWLPPAPYILPPTSYPLHPED